MLVSHGLSQQSCKEEQSHGNEVLMQDTTLQISYKDHVTKKRSLCHKRHKLKWYGHVSCSSGMAKIILQGTVEGRRRQGRQKKRWEDIVREWTGLEFAKSQRAVENREKWRKLVVKSSVVPQQPPWLTHSNCVGSGLPTLSLTDWSCVGSGLPTDICDFS